MNEQTSVATNSKMLDIRNQLKVTGVLSYDHVQKMAQNLDQKHFVEYMQQQPLLIGSVMEEIGRGMNLSDYQFIFPFVRPQSIQSKVASPATKKVFVIGRSQQEANLIIPDHSISDKHLAVKIQNSGIFVKKLSVKGKVLINEESIDQSWVKIHDGNTIILGRFLFRLLTPSSFYHMFSELLPQHKANQEGTQPTIDDTNQDPDTRKRKERAFQQAIIDEILERPHQDQTSLLGDMDRITFFDRFTDYQKRRLLIMNAEVKRYSYGQYILREGEWGERLYIILKGTAVVLKQDKSIPLREMKAGHMFGEVCYLMPEKRSASVMAKEDVIVLTLSKNRLAFIGVEIRDKIQAAIADKLLLRLASQREELTQWGKVQKQVSPAEYRPIKILDKAGNKGGALLTKDIDKITKILGKIPFFESFTDYELTTIAKSSNSIRYYKAGQMIIHQHEKSRSLFVMLNGEVAVVVNQGRKQSPLTTFKPGEFFGESSFLTGEQRTANVVAMTDTIALNITNELLTVVGIEIRVKIRHHLIVALIRRMMKQTEEILQYRMKNPEVYALHLN